MIYKCINCNNTQDLELDPNIVTYPECEYCSSIMHNGVFETPLFDDIRAIAEPVIASAVLPVLINSGKKVKLRWYDGMAAANIPQSMIDEVRELCAKHGLKFGGKPICKRYLSDAICEEYLPDNHENMAYQHIKAVIIKDLEFTDLIYVLKSAFITRLEAVRKEDFIPFEPEKYFACELCGDLDCECSNISPEQFRQAVNAHKIYPHEYRDSL